MNGTNFAGNKTEICMPLNILMKSTKLDGRQNTSSCYRQILIVRTSRGKIWLIRK